MTINCGVWALLLFIASCVIGDLARLGSGLSCGVTLCHQLGAGAVSITRFLVSLIFMKLRQFNPNLMSCCPRNSGTSCKM